MVLTLVDKRQLFFYGDVSSKFANALKKGSKSLNLERLGRFVSFFFFFFFKIFFFYLFEMFVLLKDYIGQSAASVGMCGEAFVTKVLA